MDYSRYLPGSETGSSEVTVDDDKKTVVFHGLIPENHKAAAIQAMTESDCEGYEFIFDAV
jgi:hypothetical protein